MIEDYSGKPSMFDMVSMSDYLEATSLLHQSVAMFNEIGNQVGMIRTYLQDGQFPDAQNQLNVLMELLEKNGYRQPK